MYVVYHNKLVEYVLTLPFKYTIDVVTKVSQIQKRIEWRLCTVYCVQGLCENEKNKTNTIS